MANDPVEIKETRAYWVSISALLYIDTQVIAFCSQNKRLSAFGRNVEPGIMVNEAIATKTFPSFVVWSE